MMYMETPDLITTDAEKPGRRTCLVRRPGFLYLFFPMGCGRWRLQTYFCDIIFAQNNNVFTMPNLIGFIQIFEKTNGVCTASTALCGLLSFRKYYSSLYNFRACPYNFA